MQARHETEGHVPELIIIDSDSEDEDVGGKQQILANQSSSIVVNVSEHHFDCKQAIKNDSVFLSF